MSVLRAARAKDREFMAKAVEAIAAEFGVECKRNEVLTSRRAIYLEIKAQRGLEIGIGFDGDSGQDRDGLFCLPWCIWGDGDARLSYEFGRVAGAEVNPNHRRKCTAFAGGFADLCAKLRAGLELARDGGAFQ